MVCDICVYTGELHKILVEVDVIVHVAKGTRQEWIEGSDTTHEFFTMDYSHVRRRWPIHNKSSLKTIINSPWHIDFSIINKSTVGDMYLEINELAR